MQIKIRSVKKIIQMKLVLQSLLPRVLVKKIVDNEKSEIVKAAQFPYFEI